MLVWKRDIITIIDGCSSIIHNNSIDNKIDVQQSSVMDAIII